MKEMDSLDYSYWPETIKLDLVIRIGSLTYLKREKETNNYNYQISSQNENIHNEWKRGNVFFAFFFGEKSDSSCVSVYDANIYLICAMIVACVQYVEKCQSQSYIFMYKYTRLIKMVFFLLHH